MSRSITFFFLSLTLGCSTLRPVSVSMESPSEPMIQAPTFTKQVISSSKLKGYFQKTLQALGTKTQIKDIQVIKGSLTYPRVMDDYLMVPIEQLRQFQYENELMGWIVLGIQSVNQNKTQAVLASIQLLYQRGYDPRGLLVILKPDPILTKVCQREIADLPPLRNPTHLTQEFLILKESIRNL